MRAIRSHSMMVAQLPLFAFVEMLEVAALVLSLLVLTNALWNWGFLLFDTSSLGRAVADSVVGSNTTNAPAIYDWYEAHYHSICYGMWNDHVSKLGRNMSAPRSCTTQSVGYTFGLAHVLSDTWTNSNANTTTTTSQAALALLDTASSYGTVDTKAPVGLLVAGIIFTGLSQVLYLDGIICLRATNLSPTILLNILRAAFLSSIPAVITLTISAAKITARARQIAGTVQLAPGVTVKAGLEVGFFVATWNATVCMWIALVVEMVAAFRIAAALEREDISVGGHVVHEKRDVYAEAKMEK